MNYFHTYFDDLWDSLTTKGLPRNVRANTFSMPPFPHSNVWVSKDTDTLTMEFALAGYDEENISVTASNNAVTIQADPKEIEDVLLVHTGISRKQINFTLAVDKAFDVRKTRTSFKNGLLTLEIKKAKSEQSVKLM
jgi:HSP20 family molecular chaperone IbpA